MNTPNQRLSAIFRTPERITLTRTVLLSEGSTVQQMVSRTHLSKGFISPFLALLEGEGLLVRQNRVYRPAPSALTFAVKRLLNIDLVSRVFQKPEWALGIGIYGSWADGTNTEGSDLDLWVLCKTIPPMIKVANVEHSVASALSVEVHLMVLNMEKIEEMKRSDLPFYLSFLRQSITLEGESPVLA